MKFNNLDTVRDTLKAFQLANMELPIETLQELFLNVHDYRYSLDTSEDFGITCYDNNIECEVLIKYEDDYKIRYVRYEVI